jgi:hypothetical protein
MLNDAVLLLSLVTAAEIDETCHFIVSHLTQKLIQRLLGNILVNSVANVVTNARVMKGELVELFAEKVLLNLAHLVIGSCGQPNDDRASSDFSDRGQGQVNSTIDEDAVDLVQNEDLVRTCMDGFFLPRDDTGDLNAELIFHFKNVWHFLRA